MNNTPIIQQKNLQRRSLRYVIKQKRKNRQRPAFPGGRPPSIIGAEELNFCVRDGYRCDLFAVVTGLNHNRISTSKYA